MRRSLLLLIVVLAFGLLASGCFAHVTGGGYIDGKYDGKATFGFNFQCDGFDAKGQLTYHDPGADLKVKGEFTHCTYGIGTVTAWGDYRPQGPSDLDGGTFKVTGVDNGEPGIGEDWVKIKLWDDSGFNYKNYGDLMGGNIQEH